MFQLLLLVLARQSPPGLMLPSSSSPVLTSSLFRSVSHGRLRLARSQVDQRSRPLPASTRTATAIGRRPNLRARSQDRQVLQRIGPRPGLCDIRPCRILPHRLRGMIPPAHRPTSPSHSSSPSPRTFSSIPDPQTRLITSVHLRTHRPAAQGRAHALARPLDRPKAKQSARRRRATRRER